MKCTHCGYDDQGTGDTAHACPAFNQAFHDAATYGTGILRHNPDGSVTCVPLRDALKEPDQRAKFEWWYSDQGQYPKAVERRGDGYVLMQAQDSWVAWQACAASNGLA